MGSQSDMTTATQHAHAQIYNKEVSTCFCVPQRLYGHLLCKKQTNKQTGQNTVGSRIMVLQKLKPKINTRLLLLLLSRFNRVRLCETP